MIVHTCNSKPNTASSREYVTSTSNRLWHMSHPGPRIGPSDHHIFLEFMIKAELPTHPWALCQSRSAICLADDTHEVRKHRKPVLESISRALHRSCMGVPEIPASGSSLNIQLARDKLRLGYDRPKSRNRSGCAVVAQYCTCTLSLRASVAHFGQ